MTILIVDGYNAIYAIPEAREKLRHSLLSARRSMLAMSREYVRKAGHIDKVKVVFDGDDKYRHAGRADDGHGRVQIFSGTGQGDDKIIETIRSYSRGNGVRVVVASNDNYVRNNARAYGAGIMDVRAISGKARNAVRPGRGSDKDIDADLSDRITREYRRELGV